MAVDTTAAGADAPVEHKRATVRPDKAQAVAELAEEFRTSSAAVLTEYRGLSVKQVTALRVALGADTTYAVVKNTLTRLAAADAGLEGMDELLTGPTAVAFVKGEPVDAAKALRDYARTNPQLVVKGGVLDGKPLTADEVRRLADLESREVLLAKMAGALLASLSGAAALFQAPLAQVARVAGALQAKAEEDPSVIGGAGTPSAADAPSADAVTADTAADALPDAALPDAGQPDAGQADASEAEASLPDAAVAGIPDGVEPASTDPETA